MPVSVRAEAAWLTSALIRLQWRAVGYVVHQRVHQGQRAPKVGRLSATHGFAIIALGISFSERFREGAEQVAAAALIL